MNTLNRVGAAFLGLLAGVGGILLVMALTVIFSLYFEVFTGVDLIRDHIRPFFSQF